VLQRLREATEASIASESSHPNCDWLRQRPAEWCNRADTRTPTCRYRRTPLHLVSDSFNQGCWQRPAESLSTDEEDPSTPHRRDTYLTNGVTQRISRNMDGETWTERPPICAVMRDSAESAYPTLSRDTRPIVCLAVYCR
jgi:hypothetical protein